MDGKQIEGTFRAHQVPLGDMDKPAHIKILEHWMKSYRPQELVRQNRQTASRNWPNWRPKARAAWARIRTPTADCCCAICSLPDFRDYAVKVPKPGAVDAEATRVQGEFIRDVMKLQPGQLSACSARTKPRPTAGAPCSK